MLRSYCRPVFLITRRDYSQRTVLKIKTQFYPACYGRGDLSCSYRSAAGTGGLVPQISLAYRSGASRNSEIVGAGLSLDIGPQSIERSTRKGAPNYDASDTYELGGQRLKETATTGLYFAERYDGRQVRRIVEGGRDYWLVLSPDGTRRYYGYHADTHFSSQQSGVSFGFRAYSGLVS